MSSETSAPEVCPLWVYEKLAAKLDAQAAETARLLAEVGKQSRLRGIAEGKLAASEMAGVVEGWQSKCSEQAAEIERLREALEPFAQCAEAWREKYSDTEPLVEGFPGMPDTPVQLCVSHLVTARTALQGEKNDG